MAVKIRMMRIGRRHRPFFRINAVESRNQRNGRILEKLGSYGPIEKDKAKQVVINLERVKHWLNVGAVPTDAISQILLRHGIKTKHYEATIQRRQKAKAIARAAGKSFTKAERLAAAKAETTEPTETPETAETEEVKAEAPKTADTDEAKAETPKTADTDEAKAETPEAAETDEVKAEADETSKATKPDKAKADKMKEAAKADKAKAETTETSTTDEGDKAEAEG